MLRHLEMKCKRQALGWTQEELAIRCGISPSTISVYERGEPVSFSVSKNIVGTIEGYIRRLNEIEYNRVKVVSNVLGLEYQIPEERLLTYAYINMNLGYLQRAEMEALNEEKNKEKMKGLL